MRHQSEHVPLRIREPRDVALGPVGIPRIHGGSPVGRDPTEEDLPRGVEVTHATRGVAAEDQLPLGVRGGEQVSGALRGPAQGGERSALPCHERRPALEPAGVVRLEHGVRRAEPTAGAAREEAEFHDDLEAVADPADQVTGTDEILELGPDRGADTGRENRAGPDVVAGREPAREEHRVEIGEAAPFGRVDVPTFELLELDDLGARPELRARDQKLLVAVGPLDRHDRDAQVPTAHDRTAGAAA